MKQRLIITAFAACALAGLSLTAQAQKFITMGTGGVTGVYFPAGGAICAAVNRGTSEHGYRCSTEATGGSVFNINSLRSGKLDMGLAQSDWHFHAYHGTTKFKQNGAFSALRSIVSFHPEPATIVARADSGIRHVKDIKGKRFNVGPANSGSRSSFGVLAKYLGIKPEDLKSAEGYGAGEVREALCSGKIDAYIILIGHPSGLIRNTLQTCRSTLVPIFGPEVDQLVKENPFYRYAIIPGGMYDGVPEEIRTYGVGATLVTTAEVPEEVVYVVTKAIVENLEAIKKMHPAFAQLKLQQMVKDSLTAPLHKGVIKYYKERGWM